MPRTEIPQEWKVLMDRKGYSSLRRLAEAAGLGHTTVNRVVLSRGYETTEEVLQRIADALNVDYTTVYRLAGRGVPVAQKWQPPASSARLTREQREVLERLIETMVSGSTERVDHPERGHLRLAADRSHGPSVTRLRPDEGL